MQSRWTNYFICFSCLTLTACTHYQAQALNPEAIAKQQQTPKFAELQLQASEIKHRLLKPISFDFSDGLSADEAAIVTVLQNPELRLARGKRDIAGAQLLQAGLLPNPRFAYNYAAPIGGLDQGKVQGYGLSLDWEFTALLSKSHKESAASAEKQAIDLQIAWQEWQFAQAAKLACYQLQVYQQQQTLLTENLQRLKSNVQRLTQAATENLVTLLDVTTATNASDVLESRLQTVLQQQALQQARLNRALGLKPDALLPLQSTDLPDELVVADYQQLSQHLAEQRLDLLALQQGYLAQEEQVHIAVLQQFPKISIGPTQSLNNSDYYTLGAGFSLSLPLFDQNQGAIALTKASRQMLFDEYSNRDFQSKADIAEVLSNVNAINQQLKTAHSALNSLENLLNAYHSADKAQHIDQLSYFNAWNNVNDKQIEILNLQLHLIEARTALETATGNYQL